MTEDLRGKMARGAAWMVLFKFIDRGIGLLSTLLLARLLSPGDFGIVGMAMAFVALLELLGGFGFDMALIQRADATPAHYNTAWTFNVIVGATIGLLMLAGADLVAEYYHQPTLAWVIRAMAVNAVLQGFGNIGVVAFRKEMQFNKEFWFLLSKRLITFPVTITLAFVLKNYWALVIGIIAGRALELGISYVAHPYRPRFTVSAAPDLLHFSKWLLVLNLLNFIKERAAYFVVGRMGGAHALGLFSVTYELASMPGTELVAPINRAVYPAYARIAHDRNALQREYLSVMGMISLAAIPAIAGMAAVAKLLVPLALGPDWLDAIPVLQLLAFFGIAQVMQSNAYSLCLASGRVKVYTGIQTAHASLIVLTLIVFMYWRGLNGAALAYVMTALVMLPITFGIVLRMLAIPVAVFLANVWRPVVAAAVMFLAVSVSIRNVPPTAPLATLVPALLGAVVLGVVVYCATVALSWWAAGKPQGGESIIAHRAAPLLGKLRALRQK
jgi:lipopolysaccharide exporter